MLRSATPLRNAYCLAAPAVRPLTRGAHSENTINNNFPFDHNNKARFTAIYWGALTVSGVVVPVVALYIQLAKGGAYDKPESS